MVKSHLGIYVWGLRSIEDGEGSWISLFFINISRRSIRWFFVHTVFISLLIFCIPAWCWLGWKVGVYSVPPPPPYNWEGERGGGPKNVKFEIGPNCDLPVTAGQSCVQKTRAEKSISGFTQLPLIWDGFGCSFPHRWGGGGGVQIRNGCRAGAKTPLPPREKGLYLPLNSTTLLEFQSSEESLSLRNRSF